MTAITQEKMVSSRTCDDFDTVFSFNPKYTFPSDIIDDIVRCQKTLHGKTFYERLLEAVGITLNAKLFPPANNRELRRLHESIINSTGSEDQKQSLLYYLLRNVRPSGRQHDIASNFSERCLLSNKSLTFIEGIWHLDHLQWQAAIAVLTVPSLQPRFSDEILRILLDKGEDRLASAYYEAVSTSLGDPDVLREYFTMLCNASITEAYFFARTQKDSKLFELLLRRALLAQGMRRVNSVVELVDLPLTQQEELQMEDFFLRGEGRNLDHAADVIVMRKIATGKLSEIDADIKSLEVTKRAYKGTTWQNVLDGINKGMGPRRDIME